MYIKLLTNIRQLSESIWLNQLVLMGFFFSFQSTVLASLFSLSSHYFLICFLRCYFFLFKSFCV